MVVLMLGAGLCLLLLLLSLAVRLRLGIPLVYVLLMLTVFHGWYQANTALADGILLLLVGAAALMSPSKSVHDMELSSLRKKFKDKKFAAGCSRETVTQGAQLLGWELNDLLERTLQAMKACETDIEAQCAAL